MIASVTDQCSNMNHIIVLTLFSVCLLCQPISSAADLSDTFNSVKDGVKSFINDPAGSLNSLADNAEGFFKNQLGMEVDFDQWYNTLSVESQNAYQKVQGLIESGKAQVSILQFEDCCAKLNYYLDKRLQRVSGKF